MTESPVIYALRAKRAEIDGELRQTEKHAAKLRNDLAAIDGALILFDPSLEPYKIRPKRKKRASMTYAELAKRLEAYGLHETEASITSKLARGTFAATFFLACLAALELDGIRLEDI